MLKFITDQQARLSNNIVSRSEGIFLWVVLVTRSLRESFDDGRDLADFEAELAELPNELQSLYEHLLSSVPNSRLVQRRMYQIFAMTQELEKQKGRLLLLSTLFLGDYEKDPEFATHDPFIFNSQQSNSELVQPYDYKDMASRARKLVQGYCKGLLEVRHYPVTNRFQIYTPPDEIFDCLTFTHRTATEFLQRPDIQSRTRAALAGFDVVDAASQLFLATVRLVRQPQANGTLWARLARIILQLRAIHQKDQAPYDYLTSLESTFNYVFEHQDLRWASWITGIHIKEEKVVVEGQYVENLSSPTMKLLLSRNRKGVSLRELVQLWNFDNKTEILQLIEESGPSPWLPNKVNNDSVHSLASPRTKTSQVLHDDRVLPGTSSMDIESTLQTEGSALDSKVASSTLPTPTIRAGTDAQMTTSGLGHKLLQQMHSRGAIFGIFSMDLLHSSHESMADFDQVCL
ncbi:hypothetical protein N0V83_001652 [Neocucurbitaria cava]|uniref:DUF7791 domain-containing protein n=1 Tax=Neocucurbitaria cava TaxID=798079 RepID=A0A9W8YGG0_9PLEO|nr:hypothetical protein N0V83_001652 [Neocucurbitaria cava]